MKKVSKNLIIVSLLVIISGIFSGCEGITKNDIRSKTDVVCLNGVNYYTWHTKYGIGVSPMFNSESKVVKCYDNEKIK